MIRSERRRVEEGWWGESGIKDTPIKYINVISDMAVSIVPILWVLVHAVSVL